MSHRNVTMLRLQKQQHKILKNPIKNCVIKRQGILHFHFCIHGLDGDYEGGYYHAVLELAPDYPFAPPVLKFITPNGRFETATPICTTFTSYHKETWSSAWNVQSMILATISFFQTNQNTAGAVQTNSAKKRELAKKSLAWNLMNEEFCRIFPLKEFENYEHMVALQEKLRKKPQAMGSQPASGISGVQGNNSGYLMGCLAVLFIAYFIYKLNE